MTVKRLLLARRRVDFWLLAAAFAALAILNPAGKAIFLLFVVCGIYLALARHRVRWLAPPAFSVALLAYCLWSAALSLLRGEPVSGNRLLSYTAIEFVVLFLPLGLALVQRPVDAMVLGARVGVAILLLASVAEYAVTGERVGLGANEAILAFAATAMGLVARLRSSAPPRFLPNTRWWPYLALVPATLTQTRAVLAAFLLVLLVDALWYLAGLRGRRVRPGRRAILLAVLATGLAAIAIGPILASRLDAALGEIAHFQATGDGLGSVNVRMVMWLSGLDVLWQHPLIGVGATRRIAEVGAVSGANEYIVLYYTHLHNFLLDEALSSGLIGLVLLLCVFAAFLLAVLRSPADWRTKETSLLFLALVFSFGFFHGVLLNEWMIVIIFGFMSIILTGLRRDERRARVRAALR